MKKYLPFLSLLTADIIWGLFPIYFKFLQKVPPIETLCHRITWAFFSLCLLILLTKKYNDFFKQINLKIILFLFISASLISVNWFTFIYAINSGNSLELSLGYFIGPLFNVAAGVFYFRDKLKKYQKIGILFTLIGVLIRIIYLGKIPFIAFGVAVSFSTYTLIRKIIKVNPIYGLTIETFLLLPIALCCFYFTKSSGELYFNLYNNTFTSVLLIGAGVLTAAPLVLFIKGAQKSSMVIVGFVQYVTPTMQFISAIFLFKEPFQLIQLISFIFIWISLGFISIGPLFSRDIKK